MYLICNFQFSDSKQGYTENFSISKDDAQGIIEEVRNEDDDDYWFSGWSLHKDKTKETIQCGGPKSNIE